MINNQTTQKKSSLLDNNNIQKREPVNIRSTYKLTTLNNIGMVTSSIIGIKKMLLVIFTSYCKKLVFLTNKQPLINWEKKLIIKNTNNNANLLAINNKFCNVIFLNLSIYFFQNKLKSNTLITQHLIPKTTPKNFRENQRNIAIFPQLSHVTLKITYQYQNQKIQKTYLTSFATTFITSNKLKIFKTNYWLTHFLNKLKHFYIQNRSQPL